MRLRRGIPGAHGARTGGWWSARLAALSVALAASAIQTPLAAQREGRGHGVGPPIQVPEGPCGMCHTSHTASDVSPCVPATPVLLRSVEETQQSGRVLGGCLETGADLATAASVSQLSRTCLRCHATADVRRRDRIMGPLARREAPATSFLQDLTDDHPLALSASGRNLDPWETEPDRGLTNALRRTPPAQRRRQVPRPECTSCHGVHTGPDPVLDPSTRRAVCSVCHETYLRQAGHGTADCISCHAMHGGRDAALLARPTVELLCRSCHERDGGGELVPAATLLSVDEHRAAVGRDKACTSCHAIHR